MIDRRDQADKADALLLAEPIDRIDATDPIEPMDSTDPTEPMDRIEPVEQMDNSDPLERQDHLELSAWLMDRPGLACRAHGTLIINDLLWFSSAGSPKGNADWSASPRARHPR